MDNFLHIMAAPFAECMVLVGIHAYLGLHVLRRRVIFVDLSLAQIAALGTTFGILFGIRDTDSTASMLIAMAFTFLGAAVFAISRVRGRRIPQEAVIGLVYAITAAISVLLVEKIRGVEHLVNIMHGRILWVQWSEVLTALVAYLAVGTVHVVFHKQFAKISDDPEKAFKEGMNVRLWDFFFYMTFGFVISFSVRVAGVLLVFVFLVAPAIMAFLVSDRFRTQLAVGWLMGVVVSTCGIYLSWVADLPTGPTVVSFYGLVLVLFGTAVYVVRAERRGRAMGLVLAGGAAFALVGGFLMLGAMALAGSPLAGEAHAHEHGLPVEAGERAALDAHGDEGEPGHDGAEDEAAARRAAAPAVAEAESARPAGDDLDGLLTRYRSADICLDRMELLDPLVAADRDRGLEVVYLFLADGETMPFCRRGAVEILQREAGEDFGLDPDLDPLGNLEALARLRTWIDGQSS